MQEIFNTGQGSQFTSFDFTERLQEAGIRISLGGRGRCMDDIFIERLWRSLKCEAVYLHETTDRFTARRLNRDGIGFHDAEASLGGLATTEANKGGMPAETMNKQPRAVPTSQRAQQQQEQDWFKGIPPA